ncbi:MAG: protein-glutamine glutaminase family protein [Crocinitomicaceae bacterium]
MRLLICILSVLFTSVVYSQNAIHYDQISEDIDPIPICKKQAEKVFDIFLNSGAFDWTDRANNCEDRANAVTLILDKWSISNGKIWIFDGENAAYGDKKGSLDGWSYHVAACIFVGDEEDYDTLIIDPISNANKLITIDEWVEATTTIPMNIYFFTKNDKYQQNRVQLNPTWKYSKDYFDATVKGLTRYNSYSAWTRLKTKKYLRRRLSKVKKEFNLLYETNLDRISQIQCD